MPFRQRNFVVPWLSLKRSGTAAEPAEAGGPLVSAVAAAEAEPCSPRLQTVPGKMLRSLAESYVREATQELNIKMWQVEGWTARTDGSSARNGAADTVRGFASVQQQRGAVA